MVLKENITKEFKEGNIGIYTLKLINNGYFSMKNIKVQLYFPTDIDLWNLAKDLYSEKPSAYSVIPSSNQLIVYLNELCCDCEFEFPAFNLSALKEADVKSVRISIHALDK